MYDPAEEELKMSLSARVGPSDMNLIKRLATLHHRTISDELRHIIRAAASREGVVPDADTV